MPEVLRVHADAPEASCLARARSVLAAGELLIYPTDTLYALGGRALDPRVAVKVREAKGRSQGKPLPVVAADIAQARSLCVAWDDYSERLAELFWPGPLTLVLGAAALVPQEIEAGSRSVAVRVPASLLVRELCRSQGPLVSTSANLAGQAPPVTCARATASVGSRVTLALDGGPGQPVASTVVDMTGSRPRLLRSGAVSWGRLEAAWLGTESGLDVGARGPDEP